MECQGRGRRRAVPSREDGGTAAERRRRGVSGLEAVMVRNKSKSFVVPLLIVLFIVHSNLFCTIAEIAPAAMVPRVPGDGRLEGSQAEGLAGRYPPLHSYGWDDKSV